MTTNDNDGPRTPTVFLLSEEQFEAVQRDQRDYQSRMLATTKEYTSRPIPGLRLMVAFLFLALLGAFVLGWRELDLKAKLPAKK